MTQEGYDAVTGAMDAQQILAMLPHRYPFMLVDRVVNCSPGKSIAGFKNVATSECVPQPDGDIALPQLLILEALAQVAVILTFRTLNVVPTGKEQMLFAGIDEAAFPSLVRSGDRLDLFAEVIRVMPGKGIGKFLTKACVNGQTAASAVMMAAMRLG